MLSKGQPPNVFRTIKFKYVSDLIMIWKRVKNYFNTFNIDQHIQYKSYALNNLYLFTNSMSDVCYFYVVSQNMCLNSRLVVLFSSCLHQQLKCSLLWSSQINYDAVWPLNYGSCGVHIHQEIWQESILLCIIQFPYQFKYWNFHQAVFI